MPWTNEKPPKAIANRSAGAIAAGVSAANSCLERGLSDEECIFAAIAAANNYDKKHQVKKAVKPTVPLHVQAVIQSKQLPIAKSEDIYLANDDQPKIKQIEFDKQGKLVVTYDDFTKVTSKNAVPISEINQSVSVAVNPVFDYIQFQTQANVPVEARLPGMLTWNSFEDALDVVQGDGTTLQLGLEQYIEIINTNAHPLVNGSVVMFSGVSLNEIPQALPMVAAPNVEPLYIIGVVTNTVNVGERGRATIFGKIRGIDTTGTTSGESWLQGDMLWVHPTVPGLLTKVRPTAPNSAISVAAVLKVSSTEGIILVRPTIFPRLFYGTFSSNTVQQPLLIDTPYAVTFPITQISSGVTVVDGSKLTVSNQGLYSFDFKLQVTSTNSSQKNIYIWARVNGNDVPASATKVTMTGNAVELAPSWSFIQSLNAGDYFELMYACDSTAILINAPASTLFCPSTPSAVIKVNQVNL